MDFQRKDPHPAGLALHLFSFSGELIELFPAYLQGRVHGRNLIVVSQKAKDCLPDLLLPCRNGRRAKHRSGHILGVCRLSQKQHGLIGLFLVA